jgi:hypothetical protein
MIATMLILLQSATPASVEEAKPYSPRVAPTVCPKEDDAHGDIVVCGHVDANDQYRLKPLTHQYDPVPGPGIGMRVGAGQANLYAATQQSPDGKPDKRIMVTLKLPF